MKPKRNDLKIFLCAILFLAEDIISRSIVLMLVWSLLVVPLFPPLSFIQASAIYLLARLLMDDYEKYAVDEKTEGEILADIRNDFERHTVNEVIVLVFAAAIRLIL